MSGGLTEVLKYGLKEMVGNQDSNISDEDIDAILEKGVVSTPSPPFMSFAIIRLLL